MNYKIITEREVITKEVTEVEVSLLGYIGHKLLEERKKADINIEQLIRRLANNGVNISSTTVSRIEKGICSLKVEDLAQLCKFYGISIVDTLPTENAVAVAE